MPLCTISSTRLHIPNDEFALPVDGKRNHLRLKSFAALARRWGMPRDAVRTEAERMVRSIDLHLDVVLTEAGLPEELVNRYRSIVRENIEGLGI